MIDFIRSLATEGGMRPMLVIPIRDKVQLLLELLSSERHEKQTGQQGFYGKYEPFDNGNAAIPPNCPESRLDALLSTPILVALVPELNSLVAVLIQRLTTTHEMWNRTPLCENETSEK